MKRGTIEVRILTSCIVAGISDLYGYPIETLEIFQIQDVACVTIYVCLAREVVYVDYWADKRTSQICSSEADYAG